MCVGGGGVTSKWSCEVESQEESGCRGIFYTVFEMLLRPVREWLTLYMV